MEGIQEGCRTLFGQGSTVRAVWTAGVTY